EAILHAYRVWGQECLERLRGMFAWCLIDKEREAAWFCRDRLGVKPLYLARPRCGGLLFAPEGRTLLAAVSELLPPCLNPAALESYLAQGSVGAPQCIIKGVELLGPGQSLTTDWLGRACRTVTYWKPPFVPTSQSYRGFEDSAPAAPSLRRQALNQLGNTL